MIIAHRQLQYSTGPGLSYKPQYTGPLIIIVIDKYGSSVALEHTFKNRHMKANFTLP